MLSGWWRWGTVLGRLESPAVALSASVGASKRQSNSLINIYARGSANDDHERTSYPVIVSNAFVESKITYHYCEEVITFSLSDAHMRMRAPLQTSAPSERTCWVLISCFVLRVSLTVRVVQVHFSNYRLAAFTLDFEINHQLHLRAFFIERLWSFTFSSVFLFVHGNLTVYYEVCKHTRFVCG